MASISCSGSEVGFLYLLGPSASIGASGLDGSLLFGCGKGEDDCSAVLNGSGVLFDETA